MTTEKMNAARKGKNDEFYTRLEDIEKELSHYDFQGKSVICPCNDDGKNFHKYFKDNFEKLGLKRLVVVHYNGGFGSFYLDNGVKKPLKLSGDFASYEVINLMKQCDYVITNPPFSYLGEFISVMMRYKLKFCIVGNYLVFFHNSVFPYTKDNLIFFGHSLRNDGMSFTVPEKYSSKGELRVSTATWIQNIKEVPIESATFTAKYEESRYPRFDDFDAINVDKISDIPGDYYGVMGVPITFFYKLSREQFDILDLIRPSIEGDDTFLKLLIRRTPASYSPASPTS